MGAAVKYVACLVLWVGLTSILPADETPQRTREGLLVLYDFADDRGPVVKDRAGVGKPVNLEIADLEAVRRTEGALEIVRPTRIRSPRPALRVNRAVQTSGELTVEAWLRPARSSERRPARVVTLSRNGKERNFSIGHHQDRFQFRFRMTETGGHGVPEIGLVAPGVTTELMHWVYTRDRTGRTRVYIDGALVEETNQIGGTANWIGTHRLALGNGIKKNQPWLGTFYLVALYARDLLPHEVQTHYRLGPDTGAEEQLVKSDRSASDLFESRIAPLFVKHCFECHDGASKEGGLDLSRRDTAFTGDSGAVVVKGKAHESYLWEVVESDEMPAERPPLSAEEKQQLKDWINQGAPWPVATIDPLVYSGSGSGPAVSWLRRLTVGEYVETVRAAVGVDVRQRALETLPPDLRADGFSNTAYNLNVDLKHVRAYAELASLIVSQLDVPAFAAEHASGNDSDPSLDQMIAGMGKRLLRSPLEEHELTAFLGLADAVLKRDGDQSEALGFVLEAMLQSPRFLYRVEIQRGDGTPWPVGDYELASRLSYILWGAPPDEQLMEAADTGRLYDRSGLMEQVQRMLADPRAVDRSLEFIAEWLDLDRLANLRPNAERFPNWSEKLAADMRQETLAYFKHVVWTEHRPLSDLLNAPFTYATPRLAAHYGLTPGDRTLARYDLSSVGGRGGLLTHGSVLTVGGDEASMVARGLFVLRDLLRGSVQDPPPCVDTTPVPTKPGLTQRAIAEARIANASCGGCHSKFEPLAFGLERFDGVGAYHETDEHGNPLRDDGRITFPGSGETVSYSSSAELMDLLAASDRVKQCITWKVTQFAMGRPLKAADAPVVSGIHDEAQRQGGTYDSLMTAIVLSDLVQKIRTEPNE